MRAAYLAALVVLFAAAISIQHSMPRRHTAHQAGVLLAQSVTSSQSDATAPHAPAKPQSKNKDADAKQKPDSATQPPDNATPGTTPWLGAPPQFQRTWPPTALPQSDDTDDLLLMMAPHKPPKLHRA